MTKHARNRSAARWPFWLMIVAWVCANSPQAATYALVTWIGEARNFSHQQRLTSEVAHVLTGTKADEKVFAIKKSDTPARPLALPVPAEATLKKIQLAVEFMVELRPPAEQGTWRGEWVSTVREARVETPPHEPPRAGRVS